MNSISRGTLLPKVTALILSQRSNLPIITTGILVPGRVIRTQSISRVSAAEHAEPRDGVVKRIIKKYNLFNFADSKLKQSGYFLYEAVADRIDYTEFFLEFKMSDTFFSWFLITELHVWMLMVRLMAEQEDGKTARNSMIEAMWSDSTTRAKVLWIENPGGVRRAIKELSEQFNSAIIGYDEGVNADDKILAGAIWRRFFQLEGNNPEDIEKLLIYIRKQIKHLDKMPRKYILETPNIEWLPLKENRA